MAFDTSAAHCAAALLVDGQISVLAEEMARGQADALMPMLDRLLKDQGVAYRAVVRLAVGVGPGNFTGLRIAVSTARGLAMGLGIPAIGITGFEAILHGQSSRSAAILAPRDMAYLKEWQAAPRLVAQADIPDEVCWPSEPGAFVRALAEIAATAGADRWRAPPAPLYIRPADAAPPRDAPPVILDDPD